MDLSPKAKETKEKTNKWGLIKRKSFSIAKETTKKKMKRQPIKWDKISVKDMTSKGLTSRIYK